MPQLIGVPLAAAATLVAHAGLKVGPVQNSYSEEPSPPAADAGMAPADTVDPAGTVLSQSPIAGHRVEPGTIVTFRVAQSEKKQQVPPLRCAPVGMTIHWESEKSSLQQNCHPDRSAA